MKLHFDEMDIGVYHGAMMDLVWGGHGRKRNGLVHRYWQWLDNIKGLGASRHWIENLLLTEGVHDDPHSHIIAAIVAERLK